MNHTPNYQLNQWERSDKVLMDDFNADNAKLDAALGELSAQVAGKAAQATLNALSNRVARLGNCSIETQTYTGTGECGAEHPTRITFPDMPTFFVIFGGGSIAVGTGGDAYIVSVTSTSSQSYSFGCFRCAITWSGNQLTLQTEYHKSQLNYPNEVYHVVSFYNMDAK